MPGSLRKADSSSSGQEFGDRRAHLSGLVVHEVRHALCSPLLGDFLERRELAPREGLRHAEEPDGVGPGEDPELRSPGHRGRVFQLEAEAQVGLVRAEA